MYRSILLDSVDDSVNRRCRSGSRLLLTFLLGVFLFLVAWQVRDGVLDLSWRDFNVRSVGGVVGSTRKVGNDLLGWLRKLWLGVVVGLSTRHMSFDLGNLFDRIDGKLVGW